MPSVYNILYNILSRDSQSHNDDLSYDS